MKSIPYILISAAAILFSFLYWQWGVAQGPVASLDKVPGIFGISNIIASILFFGSAWFALRKGFKTAKISFLVLGIIFAWFLSVVFLGIGGFFAWRPLFAPNIIFAFIFLVIAIRFILSSKILAEAFTNTPIHFVITAQVFRVMGVGFLALYAMRVLPGEFAIPTGAGDVLIGVTGPIVAYLYTLKKPFSKKLAIFWNYAGIADLCMSIVLGNLTYPEPLHIIPTTVSNLPIALYPLVIIPVFAVPFSILLHLFSLRILKKAD